MSKINTEVNKMEMQIEQEKRREINWEIGGKYKIFGISSMMACNFADEVQVVDVKNGKAIFKQRGKRKLRMFGSREDELIVFKGWDLPIWCDSEGHFKRADGSYGFSGNACFNFVGDAKEIRSFITQNNLNPDIDKSNILVKSPDAKTEDDGDLVFPESYRAGSHAVVDRMMAKKQKETFGETIVSYTSEQAESDGILMKNPKQDVFPECDLITTNLFRKIEEMADRRNLKRVFEQDVVSLVGCLMDFAKSIYNNKMFKGDNDENFFVIPENEDGVVVWFERNENGKLTALLPEDH